MYLSSYHISNDFCMIHTSTYMCVYIYLYVHNYICTYIYTYIYKYLKQVPDILPVVAFQRIGCENQDNTQHDIYGHINSYIYTIHICTYIYMHIHICLYIHANIFTYIDLSAGAGRLARSGVRRYSRTNRG